MTLPALLALGLLPFWASGMPLPCKPGLFYPDPIECSRYYMCDYEGNIHMFVCPTDMAYISETQSCKLTSETECKTNDDEPRRHWDDASKQETPADANSDANDKPFDFVSKSDHIFSHEEEGHDQNTEDQDSTGEEESKSGEEPDAHQDEEYPDRHEVKAVTVYEDNGNGEEEGRNSNDDNEPAILLNDHKEQTELSDDDVFVEQTDVEDDGSQKPSTDNHSDAEENVEHVYSNGDISHESNESNLSKGSPKDTEVSLETTSHELHRKRRNPNDGDDKEPVIEEKEESETKNKQEKNDGEKGALNSVELEKVVDEDQITNSPIEAYVKVVPSDNHSNEESQDQTHLTELLQPDIDGDVPSPNDPGLAKARPAGVLSHSRAPHDHRTVELVRSRLTLTNEQLPPIVREPL